MKVLTQHGPVREDGVRYDVTNRGQNTHYRSAMPSGFLECAHELIAVLGAEGRRIQPE